MTTADKDRDERQFERLVFFSDAVFAIAITLLVLDLKPPDPRAPFDLRAMAPGLEGFAISFFVISLYWLSHHELFGTLRRENRRLRITNLAFLAGIAFLPYPTSVIASYRTASGPVVFYALSVAAVGALQVALILAARRPELMRPGETAEGTRRFVTYAFVAPTIFLVSAPVALFAPSPATWLWILIWPGLRLAHWRDRGSRRSADAAIGRGKE